MAAGIFPDAAAAAEQLALPTREVAPDPARVAFYAQHCHERYARLPDALGGL